MKPNINIEVIQNNRSSLQKEQLLEKVDDYLKEEKTISVDSVLVSTDIPPALAKDIAKIKICELDSPSDQRVFELCQVEIDYHLYKLDDGGPALEEMGGAGGEEVAAATHWLLPSADFDGLWDNLIFDTNLKEQLLSVVQTTLLFSDCGVDSRVISWNRVLLLHGPPGTGKTSLCKALAQKLSIRLSHRYQYGQLFEVNSHSLFSKWFSESGKLVQKLFSKIFELVEDPQSLVCVLIDEVESLTKARTASSNGSDPSDALRVVNAILTQLDDIKRYPNVLILTTSNITGAIDLAFVDRADIKQYIGLPSQSAIYQIYYSCLMELMKTKIIFPRDQLLTLRQLQITNMTLNQVTKLSLVLWDVANESVGLSGRALRKIPFLTQALHTRKSVNPLCAFLEAMREAIRKHKTDTDRFVSSS